MSAERRIGINEGYLGGSLDWNYLDRFFIAVSVGRETCKSELESILIWPMMMIYHLGKGQKVSQYNELKSQWHSHVVETFQLLIRVGFSSITNKHRQKNIEQNLEINMYKTCKMIFIHEKKLFVLTNEIMSPISGFDVPSNDEIYLYYIFWLNCMNWMTDMNRSLIGKKPFDHIAVHMCVFNRVSKTKKIQSENAF